MGNEQIVPVKFSLLLFLVVFCVFLNYTFTRSDTLQLIMIPKITTFLDSQPYRNDDIARSDKEIVTLESHKWIRVDGKLSAVIGTAQGDASNGIGEDTKRQRELREEDTRGDDATLLDKEKVNTNSDTNSDRDIQTDTNSDREIQNDINSDRDIQKDTTPLTDAMTNQEQRMVNATLIDNGSENTNSDPDIQQHVVGLPEDTTINNDDHNNDIDSTKLILLWNSEDNWYNENTDYKDAKKDHCHYHNCDVTLDRTRIKEADLILIKEKTVEWPEYRSSNQLYVHQLGERPGPWHEYIRSFNGKINLTMNYRKSADILSHRKQFYKLEEPIPHPYKLRNPFANKTKMAIWPVSNCKTLSKREDYVKELRKYIDVDIVGRCGMEGCPQSLRRTSSCFVHWEKIYKFYLSFENAICDDYITEKYYNPLRYEIVPVTLSGPRYNTELMPHASIDAMDFKSPKDLAYFLVSVGNNETAYSEYFQWKQTYTTYKNVGDTYCGLCKAANIYKNKPAYEDYYDYWFSKCDNGYVDRLRHEGNW